ncbi:MAG: aldo/keto reductase [Clostridiales bacterium]|nr:aldo/keto reductase [Clostridiales bacterium]
MKTVKLGSVGLHVPAVAVGCMRIGELSDEALDKHLSLCRDYGLYFFDHADIYGGGECEKKFAASVRRIGLRREKMILQSKCGIVPGKMYDQSRDYILKSVDGILARLKTEYLDILLLHRPDALMEPDEVASAFNALHASGKVRHFGVSNFRPGQIELLKKSVSQPILTNQLQFGVAFSGMIASGIEANMETAGAVERDGGVLDYCRLHDITVQAWSPFQYGFFQGTFLGSDKYPELNAVLGELAEKYEVTPAAIATAWILRHPAEMQMVAGTTNEEHLTEIIEGGDITLTREEWYKIYLSAGHILP